MTKIGQINYLRSYLVKLSQKSEKQNAFGILNLFSSFECYSIPEDPNIDFEEIAAEFLKEVKKRAEEDNAFNGKLLTEELPASFNLFDAAKPSAAKNEVLENREKIAEIITVQDSLTCETLDKPCVYLLLGLSYSKIFLLII